MTTAILPTIAAPSLAVQRTVQSERSAQGLLNANRVASVALAAIAAVAILATVPCPEGAVLAAFAAVTVLAITWPESLNDVSVVDNHVVDDPVVVVETVRRPWYIFQTRAPRVPVGESWLPWSSGRVSSGFERPQGMIQLPRTTAVRSFEAPRVPANTAMPKPRYEEDSDDSSYNARPIITPPSGGSRVAVGEHLGTRTMASHAHHTTGHERAPAMQLLPSSQENPLTSASRVDRVPVGERGRTRG